MTLRRKACGIDDVGRLLVDLDQRDDDPFGAAVERLADRDGRVVRGADEHPRVAARGPDRVLERLPVEQAVLDVDHDRIGLGAGRDFHHARRAEAHPEGAERRFLGEPAAQTRPGWIEH